MRRGLEQAAGERGVVGHAVVADVADVRLDRGIRLEERSGLDGVFEQSASTARFGAPAGP